MGVTKEHLASLKESGDDQLLNKNLSITHLLSSMAMTFMEQAEDIARKHKLTFGIIQKQLSRVHKDYDLYYTEMRSVISKDKELSKHYLEDCEYLYNMICDFIQVDNEDDLPAKKLIDTYQAYCDTLHSIIKESRSSDQLLVEQAMEQEKEIIKLRNTLKI